jgi:hypothetical protein
MGKRSRRRGEKQERDEAQDAADASGDAAEPASGDAAEPGGEGAGSRAAGDGVARTAGGEHEDAGERAQGGPLLTPDGRLHQAQLLIEEADHLGHLYRWIVLTGEVPRAQDWLRREDWPHPDDVIHVFGSWEKFLQHAKVPESGVVARLRAADEAQRGLAAREQQAERELARVEDLRRQAETARRRREAAEAERQEAAARAERLRAQLDRAEARAARAEEHLAERRREAEAGSPPREEASDEWLAAHAALADELEAVREHRDELLRTVEELREQAGQDARTVSRLSAALAEAAGGGDGDGAAAPGDQDPPATVLEAVERAERDAAALRFTDAARESAADSPYRRPADVLSALQRLDRLAVLYADPGGFGTSLASAAQDLGLTWRQNVSEIARSRNPHAYAVMHDGERLELGPHVAIGSGSGAGFIARVYLHVADGSGPTPRGIYVGHVGRHLPDTTTG